MNTASITGGAFNGSTSVSVTCTGIANGTTILVCRGEMVLGSGLVASGAATVPVLTLATGDIIQASVTTRGNGCGLPVVCKTAQTAPSGWVKPTSVAVTNPNGTVSTYEGALIETLLGETLPALYDPRAAGLTRLVPEYVALPPVELGFDVEQLMQAGKTTLRVVPRSGELLLVGWNGADPASPAPLVLTSSANITVTVVRDDQPATPLSRALSVAVLAAPAAASAPAAGDITSAGWRNMSQNFIRALINCLKPCEALLSGYSTEWKTATMRENGFQEADWGGPVPNGTYTCIIRVIGETNPANYTTFVVNVI